jgi:hypothetical protein
MSKLISNAQLPGTRTAKGAFLRSRTSSVHVRSTGSRLSSKAGWNRTRRQLVELDRLGRRQRLLASRASDLTSPQRAKRTGVHQAGDFGGPLCARAQCSRAAQPHPISAPASVSPTPIPSAPDGIEQGQATGSGSPGPAKVRMRRYSGGTLRTHAAEARFACRGDPYCPKPPRVPSPRDRYAGQTAARLGHRVGERANVSAPNRRGGG